MLLVVEKFEFWYFFLLFCYIVIVGMFLIYVLEILDVVQFGIQLIFEIENLMMLVEWVIIFIQVILEFGYEMKDECWLVKGSFCLRNLFLRYVEGSYCVLRDIIFEIKDKEKVGVIGRIGFGKFFFVVVLFRMFDLDGEVRF